MTGYAESGVKGGRHKAKHDGRLEYLRARPDLVERLPSTSEDVDGDRLVALDFAEQEMTGLGLFGKSPKHTIRACIRLAVSELRGQRRSMPW